MTPARRELLAVLQRTSAREVATRCRVTRPRVSKWTAGITRPSKRARQVLESCYGIAAAGWVTSGGYQR